MRRAKKSQRTPGLKDSTLSKQVTKQLRKRHTVQERKYAKCVLRRLTTHIPRNH